MRRPSELMVTITVFLAVCETRMKEAVNRMCEDSNGEFIQEAPDLNASPFSGPRVDTINR